MKWRIVAVVASLIPLIIIASLLNVSPNDVLAVGIVPFAVSAVTAFVKLLIQGLRFHYYLNRFVGRVGSVGTNIMVRMASEFVTLTTPSYTGGELVRVAWMHKNGVHTGKGMWVITTEVVSDVLVGSTLAYVAAIWAFMAQNYLIAVAIVIITTPIFTTYMILLVLSSKRTLQMPGLTLPLLTRVFGSGRGGKWTGVMNDTLRVLCESSREYLRTSSMKTFAVGLTLTFVGASLHAVTFMVLANTQATLGFFESLLAVAASIAVGTVPISPGGSGLSEFGIGYYLPTFGMDPRIFGSVIIAWRLASYHVPLAIAWVALMKLTVGKTKQATTGGGDVASTR